MSLILDALRKMEQERKSRQQERSDIRPEVLNYRGISVKPAGRPRLLKLSVAVIIVFVGIGGWFLLKSGRPGVEKPPMEPSPPIAAPQEPDRTPPAPSSQPMALPVKVQQGPAQVMTQQPQPSPKTEYSAPQVTDASTAASGLTISGIAFQDDRRLRRAVVNGLLVSEGSEVSGARIVEILENRVRFSRDGQSFDVVHASPLPR